MDIDPLRIAERIHGHLGWLAAIALLHPAILLRNRSGKRTFPWVWRSAASRRSSPSDASSTGRTGTSSGRRSSSRRRPIGYLFERKEHLAFGALLLAWAGALAYFAAARTEGPTRDSLRKAAHWAFVAACTLAIVTASMGIVIAATKTF